MGINEDKLTYTQGCGGSKECEHVLTGTGRGQG